MGRNVSVHRWHNYCQITSNRDTIDEKFEVGIALVKSEKNLIEKCPHKLA